MEMGLIDGIYFHPLANQIIHWEVEGSEFRGKIKKIKFGIAWVSELEGKFFGTPIRHDDFKTKILDQGYIYIGPVNGDL